MTKLLNMFPMMLADGDAQDWATKIFNALENFLVPILIILCGVGLIWAVVIGVQMIKADNKEKRDENKARLINIAITIVAVIALIAVFYALKSWITTENITKDAEKWVDTSGSSFIGHFLSK